MLLAFQSKMEDEFPSTFAGVFRQFHDETKCLSSLNVPLHIILPNNVYRKPRQLLYSVQETSKVSSQAWRSPRGVSFPVSQTRSRWLGQPGPGSAAGELGLGWGWAGAGLTLGFAEPSSTWGVMGEDELLLNISL